MEAFHVLLVEDDKADVALTRALLEESKLKLGLSVAQDGEAALRCLRREAPYETAPPVDLMILDLRLPVVDGFEVLRRMRADPKLRKVAVCVVTALDSAADQERAREAGAGCFVTKPLDLEQFKKIVLQHESFWLSMVKTPPDPSR